MCRWKYLLLRIRVLSRRWRCFGFRLVRDRLSARIWKVFRRYSAVEHPIFLYNDTGCVSDAADGFGDDHGSQ